jgi:hypothetical protein
MSTFKLDMTMMFVFHDALRRDLERVTQMTARSEVDEPAAASCRSGRVGPSRLRIHERTL